MNENNENQKKSSKTRWILPVALMAMAAGGLGGWARYRGLERTDNAQVEGAVVPVHARVGGYAARVLVKDDQQVIKGDTLLVIDPTEYVIKLHQAEAELAAAKAASHQGVAGAGARTALAQRQVATSNIAGAQANLEKARRELERTRELKAHEVASQAQLEAAETALRTAEAAFQSAKVQEQALGFGENGAQAQEKLADARLAGAEAALEMVRAQLGWTVVVAPVSGHVARRSVEPGQYLPAGQSVMAVVSDSAIWVVANLKETQVKSIEHGQKVDVSVDALDGRILEGRVRTSQWATGSRFSMLPADNASGNFTKVVQRIPVRIDLVDPAARALLRPGMSAEVSIHVGG